MLRVSQSARIAHRSSRAVLVAAALACSAVVNPLAADTLTKVTILDGAQETPPVATDARGCGRFIVDTTANTLSYYIVFSGLSSDESAAHIHGAADPGVGGASPLHTLPAGNPKVGVWNYDEDDEADILAGRMYVNIHSMDHTGGEIRGQIVDMAAILNGAQETPSPITTAAEGFGLFNLDRCANTLSYYIGYSGLSSDEQAAHIHGFSLHGVGAGIQHTLPGANPKVGVWNYDEAEEELIVNGQTYVNIHTEDHDSGEIRGQITPTVVPLDGTQETPPLNDIEGHGCGMVSINPATSVLGYYLEYDNLTSAVSMQHIHGFSGPGVPAGIQHTIANTNPVVGSWTFGAANLADVAAGLTYFNVHTDDNGSGEIRGQIEFPAAPCAPDTDCNGLIDVLDLLAVLGAWGPCPAAPTPCPEDTNGDGVIDVLDLLAVLGAWGPCP